MEPAVWGLMPTFSDGLIVFPGERVICGAGCRKEAEGNTVNRITRLALALSGFIFNDPSSTSAVTEKLPDGQTMAEGSGHFKVLLIFEPRAVQGKVPFKPERID